MVTDSNHPWTAAADEHTESHSNRTSLNSRNATNESVAKSTWEIVHESLPHRLLWSSWGGNAAVTPGMAMVERRRRNSRAIAEHPVWVFQPICPFWWRRINQNYSIVCGNSGAISRWSKLYNSSRWSHWRSLPKGDRFISIDMQRTYTLTLAHTLFSCQRSQPSQVEEKTQITSIPPNTSLLNDCSDDSKKSV